MRITGDNEQDARELLQLIYEIIADKGDEYMESKMSFIKYWIVCTMQRQYHSKQSQWHYTYRKRQQKHTPYHDYHYIPEEQDNTEEDFEAAMSIIDQRATNLTSEEHKILMVYYYSNHYTPEREKPNAKKEAGLWKGETIKTTIKGTSKDIGISSSTFAQIKKTALNKLKDE